MWLVFIKWSAAFVNASPVLVPMDLVFAYVMMKSPQLMKSTTSCDYGGALGSVLYLSCTTHPDITYSVRFFHLQP